MRLLIYLKKKKRKIEKILKSIKEEGFKKTVSIFSESTSATNNGQLGFLNEESLSEEIYEKLKNLSVGNVSDPIIQSNKITFLKINEIKFIDNKNLILNEPKKSNK